MIGRRLSHDWPQAVPCSGKGHLQLARERQRVFVNNLMATGTAGCRLQADIFHILLGPDLFEQEPEQYGTQKGNNKIGNHRFYSDHCTKHSENNRIKQWRCDQKRHGRTERNPCIQESYGHRYCRAGAKRCQCPEACGDDISENSRARKPPADLLFRDIHQNNLHQCADKHE